MRLSLGAKVQLGFFSAVVLVIIIVMFIGRIGPLTMALALGERQESARFAYPSERVMVG